MTIKSKSRRRLLTLLALALLVVVGGGALYVRRETKRDDAARAAREAGLRAYQEGNFTVAVEELSRFIRRLEPDALALLRFAQSMLGLPSVDERAFGSAVVSLRRCIAVDSDNEDARRLLLDLYVKSGIRTEALEQADWILARHPDDQKTLLAKIHTLLAMRRFGDAQDALDSQLNLDSRRLEEQLLYVEALAGRKEVEREAVRVRGRGVAEAISDPRFGLVEAHALLLAGELDDIRGAREILVGLADFEPMDGEFARFLVSDLDAIRLPAESLRVLRRVSAAQLDSRFRIQLVRRLWEAGLAAEIPGRVETWGVETEALPSTVLGYLVLSLKDLGRVEEAAPLVAVLEERSEQAVARGWTLLLKGAVLGAAPSVRTRIDACLASVEADPRNAQSRYELGLAYRDAGEVELAVREFAEAEKLSTLWPDPLAAGAKLLASHGHLLAAIRAATAAEARESKDPSVALLLQIARAPAAGRGSLPERVLLSLERSDLPSHETLPLRGAMVAVSGRPATALAFVESVLAQEEPPEGSVLLNCAELSRMHGLKLEAACYQLHRELYGDTPELALVLASAVAGTEGIEAGRELLRAHRKATTVRTREEWDLAEARFLDSLGSEVEALQAWKKVVQGLPTEPRLYHVVLEAESAWQDREFVRSLIDRLREATGETCLRWQVYDAQWLLTDPDAEAAAVDRSIETLRGVLDIAPSLVKARLFLAGAYASRGQARKALEELGNARANIGPNLTIDLQLADLHLQVGERTQASDLIGGILDAESKSSIRLSREQTLAAAHVLGRLGKHRAAMDLLERPGGGPVGGREALRRAELHAASGELLRADRFIRQALESEESPRALLLAAGIAEYRGRPDDAAAFLDRLTSVVPDVHERERLLAPHFRRVGDLERAEKMLQLIVEREGAEAEEWLGLAAVQMLQGKPDELVDTVRRAQSRGVLSALGSPIHLSEKLLRVIAKSDTLRRLGTTYLEDAAHRQAAEQALRILAGGSADSLSASSMSRLGLLAESNPRSLELQLAVADAMIRRKEHGEAITLLQRALDSFPLAPEPAYLMALSQREVGDVSEASQAGLEWRSRSHTSTLEPDLFLAVLTPAEAAVRVGPYLRGAQGGDIALRIKAIERVLEPELDGNEPLIRAWVVLAGVVAKRAPDAAVRWLELPQVSELAKGSVDLQLELAGSWHAVADASGSDEALATSRAMLSQVLEGESLSPSQWERVGLIQEVSGDEAAAEQAYERAFKADPRLLVAANNLAMLQARSGRTREALALAQDLVRRFPNLLELRDTLAIVYSKHGDLPSALGELAECMRHEPGNARWPLRLVDMALDAGNREEARKRFESFPDNYRVEDMSPEQRAAWQRFERMFGSKPR